MSNIKSKFYKKVFYSPVKYEIELHKQYRFALRRKQEEIDNVFIQTKRIPKFTAKAHVSRPERVFYVEEDGQVYYDTVSEETICPNNRVEGGEVYILDDWFEDDIIDFIHKHKKYKVIFYPDGKWGPTIDYCTSNCAIPAKIIAYNGDILNIEDEGKYSPGVA
jgi:hypothetical protein